MSAKANKLRTEEKKYQTFTTESLTKKSDFISTIQNKIQKEKNEVIEIEKPLATQNEVVSKPEGVASKKEEIKVAPETQKINEPMKEAAISERFPSETQASVQDSPRKGEPKVNIEHHKQVEAETYETATSEKAISLNFSNDASSIAGDQVKEQTDLDEIVPGI